ncbi:hypothetical protein DYBT9275_02529 [Dyadobacter sp. CECT 9275]|uniref:DUF3325 domain-containing protein n=1 Tax=Dyadobacter helix TaxID=2822344 RepID=A0A916JBZ0_9BACT|nr:hypothetical protein [Dyadobacter sp. CECT 9275]CAG5000771.1 hypothetical protein DYBT9275_02529 [Dyadobacter sp. CECT 9275]
MIPFYFILLGMYLYYSKSKYFPHSLSRPGFRSTRLIGTLCTLAGSALYVRTDGWAGGLLLSLAACTLAMSLIQLFAVLGRSYFYGFVAVVHALLLIELFFHAS